MGLSRMQALPRNKAGKCVKAKVCANPSPEPSTVQKPYHWHGLALKRKRESVARHPVGQYRQHVVDTAQTLLQQHAAEEPSLFRRQRANERVEHSMVRGFEEEAAPGNSCCVTERVVRSGGNSSAVPKRYLLDVRGAARRRKWRPHLVPALALRRIKSRIRDGNQLCRSEFTDGSPRDAETRCDDPE